MSEEKEQQELHNQERIADTDKQELLATSDAQGQDSGKEKEQQSDIELTEEPLSPKAESKGVQQHGNIGMGELLDEGSASSQGKLEKGSICSGRVVHVDNDTVYLDIGHKFEGQVAISEFGDQTPKEGDEITAKVIAFSGENITLSFRQVKIDEIRSTLQVGACIKGTITAKVKGGYKVQLAPSIDGFVPFSLSGNRNEDTEKELLNLESFFLIERVQPERKYLNVVLNRKAWLEKEAKGKRDEFFVSHQVGDIVEGVVKNYTSFGAFVDLGGFDGLLHLNDMAWGHPLRPRDFVAKGQVIKVKIIALDQEKQRINFSLKALEEDPWFNFAKTYHIEDVVAGQVTKLVEYGAFVALGAGIEGLVHISELSWIKRFKHPSEVLSVGQNVEVKILDIDEESRRVSLGVRQTMENPWDTIEERYPIGTELTLKVKNVIPAGAFFELEEGIDGFLHVDDYSWTKRVRNMAQVLQVGEEALVVVIECDIELNRIRLGVKQLSGNPWEELCKLGRNAVVEGVVVGKTDFGLFIRIRDSIDGLLHKHDLVESRQDDPDEMLAKYNQGDKIKAVIQEIDLDRQRLSLSVRSLVHHERKKDMARYMKDSSNHDTYNPFGDAFKPDSSD